MDKLFKMLERGELPNFLAVLEALNEVSDIDWERWEGLRLAHSCENKPPTLPKYAPTQCGSSCEACG